MLAQSLARDGVVVSRSDGAQARRQRALNIFEVLMHPEVVAFLNPKRFSREGGGRVTGGDGGSRMRALFQRFTQAFSGLGGGNNNNNNGGGGGGGGGGGTRERAGQQQQQQQQQLLETMNAVAWMELVEAAGMLGAGRGRVTRTDALGIFNLTVAAAQAAAATARAVEGADAMAAAMAAAAVGGGPRGLTLQMFAEAMTRLAIVGCDSGGYGGEQDHDAMVREVVDVLATAINTASRSS